jgi:YVTN family beta-propeller protein
MKQRVLAFIVVFLMILSSLMLMNAPAQTPGPQTSAISENAASFPNLSSQSTAALSRISMTSTSFSGSLTSTTTFTANPIGNSGSWTMAIMKVLTNITVGSDPQSVAVSSSNAYVVNYESNTVSVIGLANSTVWKTITVGDNPYGVAVSSSNVYVTNYLSSSVSVIGLTNSTVWKTISFSSGTEPYGITVSSSNVYVADLGSSSVSVIGLTNSTVWKTISVGSTPYGVAVSSSNAYVANLGSNSVSVIGLANSTVWKTITVGSEPFGIAVSSSNVYVTNDESNTTSVIGLTNSTVWKTITVGTYPHYLTVLSANVYVADYGSNSVSVIGLANSTVWKTIAVGTKPIGVAIYSSSIYVTNSGSNTVSVITTSWSDFPAVQESFTIPTNTQTCSLSISSPQPVNLTYNSLTESSVTSYTFTGSLSVLSISVQPLGSISSSVTSFSVSWSEKVSIEYIETFTIPVDTVSYSLNWSAQQNTNATYNGATQSVATSGYFTGSMSVTTVDFVNDYFTASYTISYWLYALIEYPITFSQSGLPSGTWYVNITTTSQSFSALYNKSITFSEPNGTYSYTVATGNKEYAPSSGSGSFTVNGTSVSESVTFALYTYSITFTESGLPASTKWFVNITSGNSYSSSASSITLPAGNGTYSYTVATANKIYKPSPSSGSFTVNGSAVSESVTFTELTWEVTFTESGLPSGTEWYMNISGQSSLSSTSTSMSTYEPNGTYAYTIASSNKIYNPNPSSSTFTVNGTALSETVSFSEIIYTVTVKETGLPSGTWYFNITGGSSYSSATTSLSFSEPNGTYDYTLSTSNDYYAPSPSSGSFTVNGAALTVNVTFKLVAYNVTFKETGLPSGMVWYVVLNGTKTSSNTSSITFLKPNGTYSFTIENPVNGTYGVRYFPKNATGTVTVNGKATQVNVTFTTQYYLLIRVTPSNGGTVSPSSGWYNSQSSIKLNAIANASFMFTSWTGTGTGNYSGIYNPHNITIGGPVNETAVFVEVYSVTFTETGLPSGMLWYLNISGPRSFYSTSSSITFTEPNGTYSYSYGVNTKYSTLNPSGSITVAGSSVSVSATFHLVTYTITFIEIGLPSSDTWSVSLNGSASSPTNATSITFTMPNGTYPYSISPVSGLVVEPDSGDVDVAGQNVVVNIVFKSGSSGTGYLVSFIESGLPINGEWFVTLNGYTESSFSDLIQFYMGAGTYPYSISVTGNLHANPNFGNVTVSHNMEVTVIISNSTSSSSTTINVKKIVDNNLPLIIGSSVVTVVIGWLLSIYINPENRKKNENNRRRVKYER